MAASLDEIQAYDLFQLEMENNLASFLKTKTAIQDKREVSFLINALIEFACFNCFLESFEQLNLPFLQVFKAWLHYYSPFLGYSDKIIEEYLKHVKKEKL